jgi:hypothetical protein
MSSYPTMNLSLNQIYDTETDTWHLGAPPPSLIGHVAAVSTTGVNAPKRIYILDGTPNAYSKLPHTNQVYDPETDSWAFGAEEPIEFNGFSVTVINDLVYAFGGWSLGDTDYFTWVLRGFPLAVHSENEQYTPFGFGAVAPKVAIVSPEIGNYTSGNVSLAFTMNKLTLSMRYSLDGQDNATISGNTTITDLKNGIHNVTVYARDEFDNTGASETIIFTVDVPEPFQIAPVATASIATIAAVGVGLLLYFKKRKH